jgi:hypothetical protein
MPGGRPSTYTPELAQRVCDIFASAHSALRPVFDADPELPHLSTVYRWEEAHPEFREALQRARACRANVMAETALAIADERDGDTTYGRDGTPRPDHEWINRSRLRVETRLRLARVMNPRVYGDRVQAEVSGPAGGPITISWKE